jgi:hypothetical protein
MSAAGPETALGASPLAGLPGLRWTPGLPTIASPMRQAVDAANWIVEADGVAPVFLKIYFADAAAGLDLAAAWAATTHASALGVAPEARFALSDHDAIATTYLPPPWRPAFLGDLARPAVMTAAIAAKRVFHAGAALARVWDVFAETGTLLARARVASIALPSDIDDLAAWSRTAGAAIQAAGVDLRPCHNDGSASSLMLGPDDAVQLVDFDCAGQADPAYDLALLLNEASAFGDPWSDGVALYAGTAVPTLIDRCRIYAAADDILWGVWGWLSSATSPRRSVEFLKYGEWRLLRARRALREPGFADRLRRL